MWLYYVFLTVWALSIFEGMIQERNSRLKISVSETGSDRESIFLFLSLAKLFHTVSVSIRVNRKVRSTIKTAKLLLHL